MSTNGGILLGLLPPCQKNSALYTAMFPWDCHSKIWWWGGGSLLGEAIPNINGTDDIILLSRAVPAPVIYAFSISMRQHFYIKIKDLEHFTSSSKKVKCSRHMNEREENLVHKIKGVGVGIREERKKGTHNRSLKRYNMGV